MTEAIPQGEALRGQLAMIAGNEPATSVLEIRSKRSRGMAQQFLGIRERDRAVTAILNAGQLGDVFIGAAPRVREAGSADAVDRVWALWVDCDTSEAVEALRKFRPLPSMVIRSGTGANVHAWWQLSHSVAPTQAARSNRRLTKALGADRAATDAARIMRPAGTRNFKHDPAAPVECVYLEPVSYTLGAVIAALPDDPADLPKSQPVVSLASTPESLAGLVRVVAEASEGERNAKLNWAAYRAGDHVAAGSMYAERVEEELLRAATQAGLGEREALRTIRSGLDARRAA